MSIGLHRHPLAWEMTQEAAYKRRSGFHQPVTLGVESAACREIAEFLTKVLGREMPPIASRRNGARGDALAAPVYSLAVPSMDGADL